MRMARENAGNDMLKVMQTVFPITVQIQMDVIKNYGFTADGDGMLCFHSNNLLSITLHTCYVF